MIGASEPVRLPGIGSTPTIVSLLAHIGSSIGTGADHRIFVYSSKVPGPAHTRLGGRDSLPSSIDDGGDHAEYESEEHASDDRYVPSEEELQPSEDNNKYAQMSQPELPPDDRSLRLRGNQACITTGSRSS